MRGGMGNMQGMMKQVQKMQKEMVAAQEALEKKEFEGRAANDLVVATFTGNRQLINLDINEEIIDPEDPDMLQDMILVAVNDGLSQIATETEKTMGKYTQGMGIPGL